MELPGAKAVAGYGEQVAAVLRRAAQPVAAREDADEQGLHVRAAAARWGSVGAGIAAPPAPAEVWRGELARLEKLRYGSVWLNEGIGGREVFSQLGLVLASTERVVAATGVANIWARQAEVTQAGAATLAETYPGRVALGMGVSSQSIVEQTGQS